ncbi:MAG: hypothetical protein H0W73_11780 [Bacteroidetes bacterium]|nr:hypothetical protein [Bacteroidota bacterium]
MKRSKFILTTAGFILIVFFTSACKKYTCECAAYNAGIPESGGKGTFTVKGSEAKRKKDCTDRSTNPDVNGNYTQCVIK